jgi:predicted AAA+ superfamily ATPase
MRSIDFEEFLGAKGYGEDIIHDMLHHMLDLKPFSDVESDVFEKMFFDYCMLGGMPAIVREYLETGTFSGTLELQRQLIADYEEDIRKYTEGLDQARVIRIYRQIPEYSGVAEPPIPMK